MQNQLGQSACIPTCEADQLSHYCIIQQWQKSNDRRVPNISMVTWNHVALKYLACINLLFLRSTNSFGLDSWMQATETKSSYFRQKRIYRKILWSSWGELWNHGMEDWLQGRIQGSSTGPRKRKQKSQHPAHGWNCWSEHTTIPAALSASAAGMKVSNHAPDIVISSRLDVPKVGV